MTTSHQIVWGREESKRKTLWITAQFIPLPRFFYQAHITNQMNRSLPIYSVNFHLIKSCNMVCKYYFARLNNVDNQDLRRGGPSLPDALAIVNALANLGFEKFTFIGRDPSLYSLSFK